MPVYYDFYPTPQPKGSNKRTKYHARVVPTDTIHQRDPRRIHQSPQHLLSWDFRDLQKVPRFGHDPFAFSRFFLQPVQKNKSPISYGNQGFTLICFFLWFLL